MSDCSEKHSLWKCTLNQLFQCQKTILGDFGQSINPNHLHTLEDLQKLYNDAEFVELNKSYRSTYEIISFAKQIKTTAMIDAIERHGDVPTIIRCQDRDDEIRHLTNQTKAFGKSSYASLGIIVKTNEDVYKLFKMLSSDTAVHLLTPESTSFKNGVTITSIQMSKGLEFDEVIIPFADKITYFTEYDRSLLYVACTRAMHRLSLLHTGERSPLLK